MSLYDIDWMNFKKPRGTVYFLDKNVLQLIQSLKKGKQLTVTNELEMQQKLNDIDKSENIVSLMLSIIEGRSGRKETYEEKEQTILEEIEILKGFFRQARTDIEVFEKNTTYSAEVLSGNHIEVDEPLYLNYLKEFFKFWGNYQDQHGAIPQNYRMELTDKLIESATSDNIQLQHLVVLLTLGAVWGKQEAIKVLKPTKGCEYNAYSDISILTRLGVHKARLFKTHDCDFLTLDKGLLACFKILKIKKVSLTRNLYGGNRTVLEISVDKSFLPENIRKKLNKK